MNILDQIIIVFIIVGVITGLFRGFFREVVGTIGLLVAAIAANFASPYVLPYVGITNQHVRAIVVWILVFIVAMCIESLIARWLSKLMKAASIGWMNRLAGGLFAGIKFCLLAALIISLLEIVGAYVDDLKITSYIESSRIVPVLHKMVDVILPWCSEHILSPALKML